MFPQPGTDPGLPAGPRGPSTPQGLPLTARLVPPGDPGYLSQPPVQGGASPTKLFPLLPVCRQLPRCLRVTKVQEDFWECVTFQRGVTLGRRRGDGAGGALNVGLALPALSSTATQANRFFSLQEASSVAETVAAQ